MDQIQSENQSELHLNQENPTFQPNDTFSAIQHQEQYTTLNEIGYYEIDDDQNDELPMEDGEMQEKLKKYNPLYAQIAPSKNDLFYLIFYYSIETIPGKEKFRYQHILKRLKKFFIANYGLERGQRMNRRIDPDYKNQSTYPLCYAVMLYGIDYLSNRDIKKIFKLPKDSKSIKRINWSNAAIIFNNKAQLQAAIKPHIFDNQKYPFFEPKQEEDLSTFLPTSLPRGWYGLRPYEHKDEFIFWFVRYLTNIEPDLLSEMKEKIDFMETYNASKKIWQMKQKQRSEFDSVMNTSRYETIDRSQRDRSVYGGSEPGLRERSREKSRKDVVSEVKSINETYSQIQSYHKKEALQQQLNLNQSYVQPMSFVYFPSHNPQLDTEMKRMSDDLIMQMECLHVGNEGDTLDKQKHKSIIDLDDDMEIITDSYDPKGEDKMFFFEKKDKIAELTTLKPTEKFDYRSYVEKILQAEEEKKEQEKQNTPVIEIDD